MTSDAKFNDNLALYSVTSVIGCSSVEPLVLGHRIPYLKSYEKLPKDATSPLLLGRPVTGHMLFPEEMRGILMCHIFPVLPPTYDAKRPLFTLHDF